MNSFQKRKQEERLGLNCCPHPDQRRCVDGVVCVSCGKQNSRVLLFDDTTNSLTYGQAISVNRDEIEPVERETKVVAEAPAVLKKVCDDMNLETYRDMLIAKTLALIRACDDLNRSKKAEGRFAIPKDAKVFYCACMLVVIENTRCLVGFLQRQDVIQNFRFTQPIKVVDENVRRFGAVIEAQGLIKDNEVGGADLITARIRLYMKRALAPYPIESLAVDIFTAAVNGVWFNGKSPTAVAGCAIYHVFFEDCSWCASKFRGQKTIMAFREKVSKYKDSHVINLRANFAIPQTVHVCSETIIKRHLSDEEDE